ncbi:MAG: adenylate kinase [Planctomycetales bacterium]|nr:adenylate kinase [Planctomycetales bacterium]
MNVVILGRPGSGKGTQSKQVESHFGLRHLSTGDLLRAVTKQDTPLARKIAELIDNGNFVTDELAIEMVEQAMASAPATGYIFDGIPRTVTQGKMLDEMLAARGVKVDAAIELRVSKERVRERLRERAKVEGRVDDAPATIDRRFEVYDAETAPLIDHYRTRRILQSIDGSGTRDEVFESIRVSLSKVSADQSTLNGF